MRKSAREIFQTSMKNASDPKGDWFRVHAKKADNGSTRVDIFDEIGYWGTDAAGFAKSVQDIDTPEMHVHINSPGGEVYAGLAIYNTLKQHKAKVIVYIDGLAASAASFIAMAGDEIVMARNAQMMIHDASTISYGNADDFRSTAKYLDGVSDNIADIYMQKAGGNVAGWRSTMKDETWYTGPEAKLAGLVDTVLDEDVPEEQEPENRWDLSPFAYAGRKHAPSPDRVQNVTQTVKENAVTDTTPTKPETPAVPAPVAAAVPAPMPAAPVAPVLINGVQTTDTSAVQAHINLLETFRTEAVAGGKRQFVEDLAKDNKILATQVEALQNFALTLNGDQFTAWKASFADTPALPLLGAHAAPTAGPTDQVKDDEMQIAQETVDSLFASGLSQAVVSKTPSYIKLQALKSAANQS